MNRRAFLKLVAASVGIAAVPQFKVFAADVEPVKWTVDEFDWGYSFGVGAKWADGTRHAFALIGWGHLKDEPKAIEFCKQALRQWYVERRIKRIHAHRPRAQKQVAA